MSNNRRLFIDETIIRKASWQAFERLISRLLIHKGFSGVRIVGGSGDKGADILALDKLNRRHLFQVKHWAKPVPEAELHKTMDAATHYHAHTAIMVALNGVDDPARAFQSRVVQQGRSLTVWTPTTLMQIARTIPLEPAPRRAQGPYQETAIDLVTQMLTTSTPSRSMVVMATGLGKTFTAAEAICRTMVVKPGFRVLVLAHTNALLLQLERSFWNLLGPQVPTAIWNQNEKLDEETLSGCPFIFASRDTVANYVDRSELPSFDLVLVDECHHANNLSTSYSKIFSHMRAGSQNGPQLLGLTATPFLADKNASLEPVFGNSPLVTIDMIYGLKNGYLSQVDYRLFTDNINWDALPSLKEGPISPKSVNRTLFIKEWDDGVITQLQKTWGESPNPKAIVFCGSIDHALAMRDKINARGFCKAEAIHSGGSSNERMSQYERNLVLADFEAGSINVICTVDVFNEGIDVPDVNIIVFNRVTHSRRIFIQQLGRGLRLTPGKEKAIVLDFAQDIRRFAAGIDMKNKLNIKPGSSVSIGNKVEFRNAAGADPKAESFLRAWLEDVEAIELADDEEAGVLKFPPSFD